MKLFNLIFLFIISFCVFFQSRAEGKTPYIQYNRDALIVMYGQYVEIEFRLRDSGLVKEVVWDMSDVDLPVGLELSTLKKKIALLSGWPYFTGKWCGVLRADIDKRFGDSESIAKRICFISQVNENIKIPLIYGKRKLKYAFEDMFYETTLPVSLPRWSNIFDGYLWSGRLPYGIDLYTDDSGDEDSIARFSFEIAGSSNTPGRYVFVLSASDEEGSQNFKQFELNVLEDDDDDSYICPIGHYYDDIVGYCVPERGIVCGPGTFYDPEIDRCIAYPDHPRDLCDENSYYDHFLNRCVLIGSYRCPYNYEWDSWENRCTRLPYSCPIGYRYDWVTRSCEYMNYRTCSLGSHWDSYYDRCVRNYSSCLPGHVYRRGQCRPVRRYRSCGLDMYWDPVIRRCLVRSRRTCGSRRWSYEHGRCVRRSTIPRICTPGTRWSERRDRCVPNMRPMPMRPHRPMPMRPRPLPRPRPMRPIPMRPAPMRPIPMRPAPMRPIPMRPAPMRPIPMRPAPMRPIPMRPAPMRPIPMRPAPMRPIPMRPAPMRPAPMRPAPMRPAPMRPAPMRPAPMRPAPMRPAPMRPAPMRPAPMRPAPMRPAPMRPAPMRPRAMRPAPMPPRSMRPAPMRPRPMGSSPMRPRPMRRRHKTVIEEQFKSEKSEIRNVHTIENDKHKADQKRLL